MEFLDEQVVGCPYCGESIDVLIDQQDAGDEYIEDWVAADLLFFLLSKVNSVTCMFRCVMKTTPVNHPNDIQV